MDKDKEIRMDLIILKRPELRLLRKASICKKITLTKDPAFKALNKYGLIKQNYSGRVNQYGAALLENTVSLSDFGERFLIYTRRQCLQRYLTPVVVSVATTAALHLIGYIAAHMSEWILLLG